MDIILFFCLILIPISIYKGLSEIARAILASKDLDVPKDRWGKPKKASIVKREIDLNEILSQ